MANLNGKTVLITAAGQGIGRASALAFIAAGAKVHATDINETALSELPKLDNLTTAKLDVLNEDAVKACVSNIGQVDVLFNCAGVVHAVHAVQRHVATTHRVTTTRMTTTSAVASAPTVTPRAARVWA